MKPKLLEADIQRACEDLLRIDNWRIYRLEQNFSERKRKAVGEEGAVDACCVRFDRLHQPWAEVLLIEWKRPEGRHSRLQRAWQNNEAARGAMVLRAKEDFDASIEGFREFYRSLGLNRRVR